METTGPDFRNFLAHRAYNALLNVQKAPGRDNSRLHTYQAVALSAIGHAVRGAGQLKDNPLPDTIDEETAFQRSIIEADLAHQLGEKHTALERLQALITTQKDKCNSDDTLSVHHLLQAVFRYVELCCACDRHHMAIQELTALQETLKTTSGAQYEDGVSCEALVFSVLGQVYADCGYLDKAFDSLEHAEACLVGSEDEDAIAAEKPVAYMLHLSNRGYLALRCNKGEAAMQAYKELHRVSTEFLAGAEPDPTTLSGLLHIATMNNAAVTSVQCSQLDEAVMNLQTSTTSSYVYMGEPQVSNLSLLYEVIMGPDSAAAAKAQLQEKVFTKERAAAGSMSVASAVSSTEEKEVLEEAKDAAAGDAKEGDAGGKDAATGGSRHTPTHAAGAPGSVTRGKKQDQQLSQAGFPPGRNEQASTAERSAEVGNKMRSNINKIMYYLLKPKVTSSDESRIRLHAFEQRLRANELNPHGIQGRRSLSGDARKAALHASEKHALAFESSSIGM